MSTSHELPDDTERDNVVPLRPGTAVEPKVFDAEIVPDDDTPADTGNLGSGTALTRRQRDRRDLVAVARVGGGVTWRFTRRHWAILCKGLEAERQRKKAERQQGDVRTAIKVALDKGDLERVAELNRQILDGRRSRVDSLVVWVELTWSVTRKTVVALGVTTGTALVLGIANGIGGWFGPWGVTDVLHTIGDILTTGAAIVSWTVGHAWLFGLAGLAVWLRRRWKDGVRLGEYVLPAHLRRDGGGQAQAELTETLLVKALGNIGNQFLNKAVKEGWPNRDTDSAWVRPPMPEHKGWGASIRLPFGADIEKIRKAKVTLAHNLGCLPAELFIEVNDDDPMVMDLFRLDRGVLREPVPEYPLLHEGTTDYFLGFLVGITPRGEQVVTPVFQRNFIAAGEMGSGKSTQVIAMICGALLDPLVDTEVWLFSDNQDYAIVEPALARFRSCKDGVTPAELTAALIDRFAELNTELETRGELLRKHGVTEVNRDVAAKEPGLRPKLIVVDECQTFFNQSDSELRKQLITMVNNFYMRARKFGLTVEWATPVPSDANLPRDMVSVTSNRACFAIKDKTRNNVVLGDKAHENGLSALGLKPSVRTKDGKLKLNDVGTAITVNFLETDGPVRFYYISQDQQRIVVKRALQLRGGTASSGQAAPVVRDPLADVLTVVRELAGHDDGTEHPRAAAVAKALGAKWSRYQTWKADQVRELLAEHGHKVPTTDRKYPVDPAKVAEALARRDAETGE